MSLHQLHFNKNTIKFRRQPKRALPPTCDTIVKNLINSPRRHLRLINKKNVSQLFADNAERTLKIKKMGNNLVKGFSVDIKQQLYKWDSEQLIEFLGKIDSFSANVDGLYIMQPIVVESDTPDEKTGWSLIEGQQRITNIYMALKYLESNKLGLDSCKSSTDLLNNYFLNTISYEGWDNFLQNKQGENSSLNDNLSNVYQVLHDWFSEKTFVEQEIWKKKLLNHTKFIWYTAENDLFESEKVSNMGGVGIESKYLN